jgi:hypothetical protein
MNNTNTMNTKNYAIVANNGLSILMNQAGQYKSYTADNNLLASLKALQSILNQVPTNEEIAPEVTKVIIGSKSSIKGFVCGSHLTYIRTGANAQGKAFSEEELKMIKTVTTMLSNRSLNVWLVTDEFVGKNSAEFKLFQNAWTVQKQELKSKTAPKTNEQSQANPQNAKALMDEIAQLKAQLEALIGAQSQPTVEETVADPDDLLE